MSDNYEIFKKKYIRIFLQVSFRESRNYLKGEHTDEKTSFIYQTKNVYKI